MKKKILLIITSFIFSVSAWSATFCVTNSTELQDALTTAQNNNAHDVIKIAEGTYVTPGSEFIYFEDNGGWDLELSGGWTTFFDNPCGQNLSGNPYNTVLDGDSLNRVLRIRKTGASNIKISGLMFVNGKIGDPLRGGGLHIYDFNNEELGTITIEKTAFINNEAKFSGALSAAGANKFIIRNNLFIINHSLSGNNISIVQNNAYGVYFTNNTVTFNTTDSETALAGLRMFVSGSSKSLVANNILWDNDNYDLELLGGGLHYLHNNDLGFRTGSAPISNVNNISLPPRYDSGILNFTPSAISPLVNKGRNPCNICPIPIPFDDNWGLGTTDISGDVRAQQGRVDIGAYESPYTPDLIFMNGLD